MSLPAGEHAPAVAVLSSRRGSTRGSRNLSVRERSTNKGNATSFLDEEEKPGPAIKRRCTDCGCCLIFVSFALMFIPITWWLHQHSDMLVLSFGHDHYGDLCGHENADTDKRYVYYPDLANDLNAFGDFELYYGICVEECPPQGTIVQDYDMQPGGTPPREEMEKRQDEWFVSLPSVALAGRCVPYEAPPEYGELLELCASPGCDTTNPTSPETPQQVCGLQRDGTNQYWLLGAAPDEIQEGWRTEQASEELIATRVELAALAANFTEECQFKVLRDTRIRLIDPVSDSVLFTYFTQITGLVRASMLAIWNRWAVVLALGVFSSLGASLAVVAIFTCCVRLVLGVLISSFFVILCVADYICFVQAGRLSANPALILLDLIGNHTTVDLPDAVANNVLVQHEAELFRNIYLGLGIVGFVCIFLYFCAVCALRKNMRVMVALFNEATRVIREIPSLIFFPMFLLVSMLACMGGLSYVFLGYVTLDPESRLAVISQWNNLTFSENLMITDEASLSTTYQILLWVLAFSFLWFYFFHVAVFRMVISLSVSTWYFYRNDPVNNAGTGWFYDTTSGWYPGRPAMLAFYRVMVYHTGSAAFGSFTMAAVTLPRMILEYVQFKSKNAQNDVVRSIAASARCCLWCLEKCLSFLTEYAYVYVATAGKPFCKAARQSFGLILKHPAQVALDKLMYLILASLACITIPLGMGVVSMLWVPDEGLAVAFVVVILAYITTSFAVGVYNMVVTTLFVCAMRDLEKSGGVYMTDGLKEALNVKSIDTEDGEEATELAT